jgi:hypothetical protein
VGEATGGVAGRVRLCGSGCEFRTDELVGGLERRGGGSAGIQWRVLCVGLLYHIVQGRGVLERVLLSIQTLPTVAGLCGRSTRRVEFWMGVGDAEEAGSSARVGGGVRRPGRTGRAGQNRGDELVGGLERREAVLPVFSGACCVWFCCITLCRDGVCWSEYYSAYRHSQPWLGCAGGRRGVWSSGWAWGMRRRPAAQLG